MRYTSTVAGSYRISISYAGQEFASSPYNMTVTQTRATANQSRVVSGPVLNARVGVPANIAVQAYDTFGNLLRLSEGEQFTGSIPQPVVLWVRTAEIDVGGYHVSFLLTKVGNYQVTDPVPERVSLLDDH